MADLKPCPFCGSPASLFTIQEDDGEMGNAGGDVISCTKCRASSHVEFGFKENLVSIWNSRIGDREIDRLTLIIRAARDELECDGWETAKKILDQIHETAAE